MIISHSTARPGLLLLLLLLSLLLFGCGQQNETPTPQATATDTVTVTETEAAPARETEPLAAAATDTAEPEPTETTAPAEATATDSPTETAATPTAVAATASPAGSAEPPFRTDSQGTPMLLIPGGEFIMGMDLDPLVEECNTFRRLCPVNVLSAASPPHTVTLDPFYIDEYEVTNQDFIEFLNTLGTHEEICFSQNCIILEESQFVVEDGTYTLTDPELEQHPVNYVTWFGAAAYCQHRGGRLPTEAEWEMAAGWDPEAEEKRLYPWGNDFDPDALNFCDMNCEEAQADENSDDGYAQTAPVGSYEAGRSYFGLYDVAGNLWEWALDWFAPAYYEDSPADNPRGPEEGTTRAVRGGSWFDVGNFTSTVFRTGIPPELADDSIGFRCAADLP